MPARKLVLYVTHLATFLSHCEMAFYFQKLNFPIVNDYLSSKLRDGKRAHSESYNRSYGHANTITDLNTAILKTMRDKKTRTIREQLVLSKETDQYILRGRIDELVIKPDRIIIIDDKNSDTISPVLLPVYKTQLQLYCFLFYEQFFPMVDVYYRLRKIKKSSREPDHIFYESKFDHTIHTWKKRLDKLFQWWSEEVPLSKTTNPANCVGCFFRDNPCDGVQ